MHCGSTRDYIFSKDDQFGVFMFSLILSAIVVVHCILDRPRVGTTGRPSGHSIWCNHYAEFSISTDFEMAYGEDSYKQPN